MLDFSKATLTEVRKKLKDLLIAREAGFNVPDLLIDTLQSEILTREGVKEVWECSRCSVSHQMFVPVREVSCRCGKIRRVWQAAS